MSDSPRKANLSRLVAVAMIVVGALLMLAGVASLAPIAENLADGGDAPADFDVAATSVPATSFPSPTAAPALPTSVVAPAVAASPASPSPTPNVEQADEQTVIGGVPAAIGVATSKKQPADETPQTEQSRPLFETPRRIVIPAIKLDSPVEEAEFVVKNNQDVGEWQIPLRAAGWHNNSAMLGEAGNVVMSGHNNIGSRVFANLRLLKPNDEIILKGVANDYRFRVVERKLLREKGQPLSVQYENASYILPDLGDDRLTLVTCWPPADNTHRLIIIAQPVDDARKGGS